MTSEQPNTSKSEGTAQKAEPFQYVAVPNPGGCITVSNSVEDLVATMKQSQLVDSNDDTKREKKANPGVRKTEQAKEAPSDSDPLLEVNRKLESLQYATKVDRGRSKPARSERSLSPRNQGRRGAADANGRIPRTRAASRESSFGEDEDFRAKRRTTRKGKGVSFDSDDDESSSKSAARAPTRPSTPGPNSF